MVRVSRSSAREVPTKNNIKTTQPARHDDFSRHDPVRYFMTTEVAEPRRNIYAIIHAMSELNSYIGNAEIFPILRHWDFYNHAGVSPLPTPATAAIADYSRHIETAAYINANWWKKLEESRALAAELLNCSKQEIAFVKNTSEGLSLVANAIDWRKGDVVVTTGVEYPTNMYPWMNAGGRFGVDVVA